MKKVISTILLSCALAFGLPQCKKPVQPTPPTQTSGTSSSASTSNSSSSSTSTASSTSNSSSSSSSNQTQGQTQTATGGNATASGGTATANNGGQSNTQSSVSNYNQVRQAPTAIAPEAFSTAPCRIAGSAGASAPVGGLSFGGSKKDKECDEFHLAAYFSSIGRNDLALQVLCNMKVAKGVKNCAELPPPPPPPAPVFEVIGRPLPTPPPVVIVVPVTVVAPPEYRTEMTVTAPKKKPAVKHLPPNCQNVVTLKCAAPKTLEK